MKGNQFERWHPATQLTYYAAAFTIMAVRMDPVIITGALITQIILGCLICRKEFLKMLFCLYVPASAAAIIINPLFSHEGITILRYFPNGNPLTLESVIYGVVSGLMVCGICILFFSFNRVMTADRIMYLTGRLIPAVALTISMTLRFIPEFKRHMGEVRRSVKGIHMDDGKLRTKIAIMESMIMWSFEKSIDRSDSMRARGYGSGRRSSYAKYRFSRKDIGFILFMVCVSVIALVNILDGNIYVQYYPYVRMDNRTFAAYATYALYMCLLMLPAADIIKEEIRWKLLQSRI